MIFLQTSTTTTIANPYILAAIALIGPVVVVVVSLLNTWITTELQRDINKNATELQRHLTKTNIDEKRIEEKRKDISRRLDEFYGPLQQYLNKSAELYKIFAKGKPVSEDRDKGFRTLTYLLDPSQEYPGFGRVVLDANDEVILDEILKIGKKIEKLIIEKASLANDASLTYKYKSPEGVEKEPWEDKNNGLLAVLGAHLLAIRYAREKKISGDVEIYKKYVYPRPINAIIQNNIEKWNIELNDLRTSQ